jgi:uncharacterized membrane protein YgcG
VNLSTRSPRWFAYVGVILVGAAVGAIVAPERLWISALIALVLAILIVAWRLAQRPIEPARRYRVGRYARRRRADGSDASRPYLFDSGGPWSGKGHGDGGGGDGGGGDGGGGGD